MTRFDFLFASIPKVPLAFVLSVSILAGAPSQSPPPCHWEQLTEHAAFSPRDTAEGFMYQNKMWLSNGYYHGNQLSRDLWVSEDGVEWTEVHSETPYDGYSEMVVFKDKIWAIKGSVWNSSDGKEWNRVLEKTPFGVRGYGEVVVHRGKMWQLGSGEDVWSSSDGVHWSLELEEAPYGERNAAGVTVHDGKIWLMGGYLQEPNDPPEKGYEDFTTFNDVWCSTDGVEWDRVAENAPWAPRMWFGCEVFQDRIWILGGYDNANEKNLGDVWSSSDGIHWEECAGGFSPRHEPTCYTFRDALWVIAGNSWPVLNDVWRLSDNPSNPKAAVSLPSGTEIVELPGLHSVMRLSDQIFSGGEPIEGKGLETLSAVGIKTVVSVDGAKPRVDQANALGMRYVHIPIGYDGIPEEAGKSFARLVREASAPIYLHCHHGKHRGPAAAAIAYIASTSCEGSEALVFLERVGTSPDYTGLWRDVENFTPPGPDEDLPELVSVAEVGSMVEAMANIDRHYDNLKLLKGANWSPLEDHPDLVPSQEALLVREAFHESNRQMTSDKSEELRTWMKEAEGKAIELETSLKEDRKEDANEHFDSLVQSCKGCHGKYRD
ncbi:MAG: hypothetical protein KC931_12645 [Candidatus Omnitrophica bacterium]|nr:hypothetical protein [Candidatus Omnitrophota bacterium]